MTHVDGLSRGFDINVISKLTIEDKLIISQTKDTFLKDLMCKLEKKTDKFFEIKSGVIYRKQNGKLLFVVPESMQSNIIRASHDDFGHVGIDKTVEYITRNYWFP